ncbi:MAG: hypothetical protein QXQ79_01830 [Candidatus Nanoarchaeia archaeon]
MVEDKSGGDESWGDCLKKYAPELKNYLEESEASTNSNEILIDKVVSINNTMYFRVFVSKESNEPSENYFERIELLRKNIGPIELKNKMGDSYSINNLLNNSNLEKPTDGCVAIYEISNMAFNEKYVKEAIIQAFNNAQSKVCTSQKSNLIEKLKQTILDHFD